MPRPPRLHVPGQILHIIARGNRRQAIFEDEDDYRRLEAALLKEAEAGAFTLLFFCLMPNHLHAVVVCAEEPIGRALHRILTAHAAFMNKKYGRTGHLFQDRFKSYPCSRDEGLQRLARYVHRNPMRAGLVKDAASWRWSSHRDYLAPAPRPGVSVDLVLSLFGGPAGGRESYRRFVEEPDPPASLQETEDPLARLAAASERLAGHDEGYLRRKSRCRDVVAFRVAFIKKALAGGHRAVDIARFLGCSLSSVSWAAARA
ncbi:MAG: transposase [Elusimicrobia bacterium]|nr:transposase [Elusimicrobiota bacterium]